MGRSTAATSSLAMIQRLTRRPLTPSTTSKRSTWRNRCRAITWCASAPAMSCRTRGWTRPPLTRISHWSSPATWRAPAAGRSCLTAPAYTAPGLIQLSVFDPARAASNTVSVRGEKHHRARGRKSTPCMQPATTAPSLGRSRPSLVSPPWMAKLQIQNGDTIAGRLP